jgi:phosphoenolpyruvate-protein kinase (PTS system EI component)
VHAGHGAGIWGGVCGEMAGDPRFAALLVGLAVDELSVSPFDAPRVKAAVRSLTFEDARQIARECLSLRSAPEIRGYLRRALDPCLPRFLLGEAENGNELESSPPAASGEEGETH